jgi:excisionase family DNA binding protein
MTILTPSEARARLRMGRNQLYSLIERREIAVVKRGRKYFVPESEVERFLLQELIPAKRSFFKSHRSSLSTPRSQDRESRVQ